MWGRGEEEMRGNFLQRLAAMRNCRPFSLHLPPHPPPSVCVLGANSNRHEPSQCTVIHFFFLNRNNSTMCRHSEKFYTQHRNTCAMHILIFIDLQWVVLNKQAITNIPTHIPELALNLSFPVCTLKTQILWRSGLAGRNDSRLCAGWSLWMDSLVFSIFLYDLNWDPVLI